MVCQFAFGGPGAYGGANGFVDYASFETLIDSLLSDVGFEKRPAAASPAADAKAAGGGAGPVKTHRPRLDVVELKEGHVVTVELPGVKKEDVSINFEKNKVTVSGELKSPADHADGTVKVSERRYGNFSRTINVPEGTPVEAIKATFEDGVLRLEMPKPSDAELASKKIEIQ